MDFGPVPTCIYDLFKAVCGDSYFASQVNDVRKDCFHLVNNKDIEAVAEPDMSYLSESDVEMLNKYIEQLKDKDFIAVTDVSHGYAWSHTAQNWMDKTGQTQPKNGLKNGVLNALKC